MLEIELKLAATPNLVLPDLVGVGDVAAVRELPALELRSVYFDTEDLRLARSGATLRHRSGEPGGPVWTLKLPQGDGRRGALQRDEHEFRGAPRAIPPEADDLATALTRGAPLRRTAELRTRRQRLELLDAAGDVLAEVADDRVSVIEERRIAARFREIEIERRNATDGQLRAAAGRLRDAGAIDAEPVPKVVRALGARATALPDVVRPEVGPQSPAGEVVRRAIADGMLRLVAHDAGTRAGDAESLHQMRVATRRLRSDLRTLGPLLEPAWTDELREELRWLGTALGTVRNLDVQLEDLRPLAADLQPEVEPLFARLEERRTEAFTALMETLRGERYLGLLERIVAAYATPMLAPAAVEERAESLRSYVDDAWRRVVRRAKPLAHDSPADDYHAVRIAAKRARYAAEAVRPGLPPSDADGATGFARQMARLQDLLGGMQDAYTAAMVIDEIAVKGRWRPKPALAAGRLIEREERRAADARSAFPKLWRSVRRRRHRSWLSG
jgi:CHAD domain-containing protein